MIDLPWTSCVAQPGVDLGRGPIEGWTGLGKLPRRCVHAFPSAEALNSRLFLVAQALAQDTPRLCVLRGCDPTVERVFQGARRGYAFADVCEREAVTAAGAPELTA